MKSSVSHASLAGSRFKAIDKNLSVSTRPAQIQRPTASLHRRAPSQQTGRGQRGRGSCSLQVHSALLLGCSLLSTRPEPRQLHTGVFHFRPGSQQGPLRHSEGALCLLSGHFLRIRLKSELHSDGNLSHAGNL